MVIELLVVQFWSEIILVISNRTRAARSFDFEITRMISDQIALHSVQLPLYIVVAEELFSINMNIVIVMFHFRSADLFFHVRSADSHMRTWRKRVWEVLQ